MVYYSWQSRVFPRPAPGRLRAFCRRAMELAGIEKACYDVSVQFLEDTAMAAANRDCLGHEGTTDVITFSYLDDPENCFPGEIAIELLIGIEVAWREGEARRDSDYARELALYISHGFLHASGEDDLVLEHRRTMRRREREVLGVLKQEFDFREIFPAPERFPAAE